MIIYSVAETKCANPRIWRGDSDEGFFCVKYLEGKVYVGISAREMGAEQNCTIQLKGRVTSFEEIANALTWKLPKGYVEV